MIFSVLYVVFRCANTEKMKEKKNEMILWRWHNPLYTQNNQHHSPPTCTRFKLHFQSERSLLRSFHENCILSGCERISFLYIFRFVFFCLYEMETHTELLILSKSQITSYFFIIIQFSSLFRSQLTLKRIQWSKRNFRIYLSMIMKQRSFNFFGVSLHSKSIVHTMMYAYHFNGKIMTKN